MKNAYLAAGAVAVFLLWQRGHKNKQADTQLQDTLASQRGSDWIGAGGLFAMWDRLSGADLVAKDYSNIGGQAVADPGRIGTLQAATPMAAWNGNLG